MKADLRRRHTIHTIELHRWRSTLTAGGVAAGLWASIAVSKWQYDTNEYQFCPSGLATIESDGYL
jgi:hypothetical protein